mmetsp:Transcript_24986/g.83393  ORF Transcript_24986/g.83393 Transcript_24986/m.83393 type:complete len:506 (-) Transcript_24986:24-1541(-)
MLRGDRFEQEPAGMHNEPGSDGDPDHWRQAFCVLPRPRKGRALERGCFVHIFASHNDDLVWFRAEHASEDGSAPVPLPMLPHKPTSNLGFLSPWRLRALNDLGRLRWLRRQVKRLLEAFSAARRPAFLLDLSEGGLMALLCREEEARRCLAVRPPRCKHLLSRKWRRFLSNSRAHRRRRDAGTPGFPARAVALGPRSARELGREQVYVLRSRCPEVVGVEFKPQSWRPTPESVDLLLSEPHDSSIEQRECDLQLWQHWVQVQDHLSTLSPSAVVFPKRFRIHVALVSCAALWQRRRALVAADVGGVNVGVMDTLASPRHFPWAADEQEEGGMLPGGRARFPCELWQQEHVVFRRSTNVVSIDGVLCDVDVVDVPVHLLGFGACRVTLPADVRDVADRLGVHALATWTEVEAAGPHRGGSSRWRSTAAFDASADGGERFAPGAFKQGVLLARNPRWGVDDGQAPRKRPRTSSAGAEDLVVEVRSVFDPARGELRLAATWVDDGRPF